MSITENKAMAIGALVIPASSEDAAARVSEYMTDYPETGLIGLVFASMEQLERALEENKWEIEQRIILAKSDLARTFRIDIKDNVPKKCLKLALIVNEMGTAQVLNAQVRTEPESPLEEYASMRSYPPIPKFVPRKISLEDLKK